MESNRDAESLAIKYEQMEEDEASVPALQDKLRKAEQKNALLERNQKMLHEKMANIDELITKFTAVNAQLKQKSQRLAHSQQEIEQLKRQRTLTYHYYLFICYYYLLLFKSNIRSLGCACSRRSQRSGCLVQSVAARQDSRIGGNQDGTVSFIQACVPGAV